MFYIVESDSQIEGLKSFTSKGAYIEIISSNDYYHPILTDVVAIYLRPIEASEGYIIPINHDEGLNIEKHRISPILNSFKVLYTFNRKELLYHFNLSNSIDVSLLYSMNKFEKLELPSPNQTVNWFYNRLTDFKEVNSLIPLTKLYQKCEDNYNFLSPYFSLEIPNGFDFYNKLATNVFYLVEQSGLHVTYQAFVELFKPLNARYNIKDNIVYTSYNLNNVTSRPTNAFNSVNFAAIPKAPEFRKAIIPQNDFLVEFDFDGYHLRLLCDQIGYELTEEPAHMQLAKLYFGKDEVAEEDYAKAKQINFHAIYGKIPPEYAFLPIFESIQVYINELWQQFQQKGFVEDPISGKRFTNELKDMHPQKLMNYMMQSLETSRNILILKEVLKYLSSKQSKLVLYTYDAIVVDFDKKDGKETLIELERILSQQGKFPIKFKYSSNLVFQN
jgi:hypothetical protein